MLEMKLIQNFGRKLHGLIMPIPEIKRIGAIHQLSTTVLDVGKSQHNMKLIDNNQLSLHHTD